MKFNPLTRRLFTNDGRLIKQLHCPFRMDWKKLSGPSDATAKSCDICQHSITDTAHFTEEQLLSLMAQNPAACVKVDLSQANLTVILTDDIQ